MNVVLILILLRCLSLKNAVLFRFKRHGVFATIGNCWRCQLIAYLALQAILGSELLVCRIEPASVQIVAQVTAERLAGRLFLFLDLCLLIMIINK